jgi:hypothetical protein
MLLGVRQASYGGVLDFKELNRPIVHVFLTVSCENKSNRKL